MLLSQRQSTQIEELESLKSQLPQPSSRSRNLSSERQQKGIQQYIDNNRQRQKVQSYSVEKSLNLSSQNTKVENLVASWQQLKQSTSLNQSQNNSVPITQFESQGRTSNRPHIIIEEECLFTEEGELQPIVNSNKNHSKSRKTPSSTRPHAKSIKEQQSFDTNKKTITEKAVPKKPFTNQGNYAQRPQTTKMASSQYVKSSPQVYKEHSLHIQKNDQAKISSTIGNTYSNNINSRTKTNAYKQIVKKGAMITEGQMEGQYIADLLKLKEQILSTYLKQNRALITSQNQIAKNFDEILEILKQDFPQ